MKKLAFILAACGSLCVQAHAQTPAPSKELAQQIQMMATLYDLRKSHLGFEETVVAIKAGAEKRGWKVGGGVDMQAELHKAGNKEAKPMKVIHLCPAGANERVFKASGGKAPALPCRTTVFNGADGTVNVVHLNLHTLSRGMQGDLAKVLGEIAAEEDALYKGILD